jgi:hypothetical protein
MAYFNWHLPLRDDNTSSIVILVKSATEACPVEFTEEDAALDSGFGFYRSVTKQGDGYCHSIVLTRIGIVEQEAANCAAAIRSFATE